MRKFIFKSILFSIIPIAGYYLFISKYADGYFDPFYLRFTNGKQQSLVLGSSRAAQALQPEVLNTGLSPLGSSGPIYNFSFTVSHSPYGPAYLNAVQRKLKPESKNGIFIVTVEPWSLATEKKNKNDDPKEYPENNLPPGNMYTIGMEPNFEYILKNYDKPYRQMMFRDDSSGVLHEDGWLEIRVSMKETEVEKRSKRMLALFKGKTKAFSPSSVRMCYLSKMILFLKKHGEVFLVRIPTGSKMQAIENKFWPDFDQLITAISSAHDVPYFNFSTHSGKFATVDGNHLYSGSGKQFSQLVCDSILTHYKK